MAKKAKLDQTVYSNQNLKTFNLEGRIMKISFKSFVLSAAALLGLAACQQEIAPEKPATATHTVTFVAETPQTKTTATITDGVVKYNWTEDDANTEGKFRVFENRNEASFVLAQLEEDGRMNITATFDGSTSPTDAEYTAFFNSGVQTQQDAVKYDYDQNSDVLVAQAAKGDINQAGIYFAFKREVAFGKMTLKGLAEGDEVNNVIIKSDKPLAGTYSVSDWTETSNVINITTEVTANGEGHAEVWFTCIPQDAAKFSVEVATAGGKTYTKEFAKPITLTQNNVKAFGVALEEKAEEVKSYTIVFNSTVKNPAPVSETTKASTCVVEGTDYLVNQPFGNISGNVYYGGEETGLPLRVGKSGNAASVDLTLSTLGQVAATQIILSSKQYSSGKNAKISVNGSEKQQPGDEYTDLIFNLDGSNLTTITLASDNYIYVKSITVVYGGKIEEIAIKSIALDKTTLEIAAGRTATLKATVAPANATNKAVSWSSSNAAIATVENGVVTAVAEGTAIITAASEENPAITATCEVSVTAASTGGEETSYSLDITCSSFGSQWSGYATNPANITGSDSKSYSITGENIAYSKNSEILYIQVRSSKNSIIYNTTAFTQIKSIVIEDATTATFSVKAGNAQKECDEVITSNDGRTFVFTSGASYFTIEVSNTTIAKISKITIEYE